MSGKRLCWKTPRTSANVCSYNTLNKYKHTRKHDEQTLLAVEIAFRSAFTFGSQLS